MKIGVIGNCQGRGVVRSIKAMVPDAQVDIVHAAKIGKWDDRQKLAAAEGLRGHDLVLVQVPDLSTAGPLSHSMLAEDVRVVPYPYLAFSGFHPDCTYVTSPAGRLRGPMSEYHSAIVCAAFEMGLPERRAVALFNAYVYAGVGFVRQFSNSATSFARDTGRYGYDLSRFLQGGQVFMHTINHPKAGIIHEMTRQALRQAGVAISEAETPEDELEKDAVWPVYPEIARGFGGTGRMAFKTGEGQVLELEGFVAASYALLRDAGGPLQAAAVTRVRGFLEREVVRPDIGNDAVVAAA